MNKILLLIFIILPFFTDAQDVSTSNSQDVKLETELILAVQDIVLEHYDEALDKLKNIDDKTRNDGIAEFEIAKIYHYKNMPNESRKYIKKAIKKDNSKIIYKQFLIDLLIEQKEYLEAASTFENLLDELLFDRKNYYEISDLYIRAKDVDKAVTIIDKLKLITDNNNEIELELYKSQIYFRTGDYDKAIEVLNNILKKVPNHIKSLEKKAMAYRLKNDNDKAKKIYEQLLKIDADNKAANIFMANNLRLNRVSNDKDYIEALAQIVKNKNVDVNTKIKAFIPYVVKMAPDYEYKNQLLNSAKKMVDEYPDNEKTNSLYADLLYNIGETDKSTQYYEKSLTVYKNNYIIWQQLMSIYTQLEKWDKLQNLSEKSLDYYPNQAECYYYAGSAMTFLGKAKEGIDYLEEGLLLTNESKPVYSEILLMKINSLIKLGKIEKADKLLKSLGTKIKENHPFYWELKGDIAKLKGQNDNALTCWKKSSDLGNNTKRLLDKLK